MKCYRIAKETYVTNLNGVGAFIAGGRWNNKGTTYMVYTAESRALAMAEAAVHIPFNVMPDNYMIIEIKVPDELIVELDPKKLEGIPWNITPPIPETQEIGDAFIRDQLSLGLKVPSAVVPGDFNIVLNPNYPDFTKHVAITDKRTFPFDKRLLLRNGDEES